VSVATTERDPKDPLAVALAPDARLTALAAAAAPVGDDYQGTARAAAKLSIAQANPQDFADVTSLVGSLPDHSTMLHHQPPITTDATEGRVAEEERNVRLPVYLYAASREADNDFHLIVGNAPADQPMYMTAEVSGLPPADAASLARLNTVRDALENRFGPAGSARLVWRPKTASEIGEETATSLFKLLETLEDSDDVQNVYANFEVAEDVIARLGA